MLWAESTFIQLNHIYIVSATIKTLYSLKFKESLESKEPKLEEPFSRIMFIWERRGEQRRGEESQPCFNYEYYIHNKKKTKLELKNTIA